MATVERETPLRPGSTEDRPEQPVFSSHNGRRARAVRVVGRGVAVLTGIWLVALVAGAMGFGSLPILPGSGLLDRTTPPAKAPADTPRAQPAASEDRETSSAARTAAEAARARADRLAGSTPSARSRNRHPTPPPAAQPPSSQQAPPVSPGKPRGRAVRAHGIPVQPVPPPEGNGNANGQAVVNRGRLKQQLPPPPPPPPPPPKKP